ncbi:MAG TPA: hypothetical protein VII45_10815 [Solirubrobacterales bacterium]|jgi:hypothetical protein
MSGSLILFPLRLGARATGLAVRGAREIVEWAAGLAGLATEAPDFHAEPAGPPTRTAPPERPTQTQKAAPEPVESAESALVDRDELVDYDAPEPAEPVHLDVDDELVGEVAEPGAEDGAGAQVSIAEPWAGYRELPAAEVIERLAAASPAELAAIELYELSSRNRQTVVAAAQRELSSRR